MKVGVVGLGRMGLAMVERLRAQGFAEVIAWDRDAARVQLAAASAGAVAADDAVDLVQRSEIVLSIINDDAGARALYGGPRGLLSAGADGKLFIEMSTLQPATVRELSALVETAGGRLVGAPVMGSIPTVRDGKLFIPAGGRVEDIERAAPVFAVLTRKVRHVGPVGAGNAMKLAVNLTMAAYLQALAEGLALGLGEGLALDDMLEVLGEAPTANGWLASKLPVLKGGRSDTTLDIASLRKDMQSAVATGALAGVPMTMAGALVATLSSAVAQGAGGEDLAQLPRLLREHLVQRPA